MKTLGNIIWLLFGGLLSAIVWYFLGLLLYVTIIGIPVGKQLFKLGSLTLFPFGKDVKTNFDKHPIANVIWLILVGWEMAIAYVVTGVLYCVTIIGIPFGLQWFKLAVLALLPFGAKIK